MGYGALKGALRMAIVGRAFSPPVVWDHFDFALRPCSGQAQCRRFALTDSRWHWIP